MCGAKNHYHWPNKQTYQGQQLDDDDDDDDESPRLMDS
jgi:hypothetical protein